MLPASDMLPFHDGNVSIEPQYDGVIMLSPDAVLFSDATPRPDGRKVYHVFERTIGEPPCDDVTQSEDFQTRREQLFSHAHENTIHNIQQVLAESGLVNQEWCDGSGDSSADVTDRTADSNTILHQADGLNNQTSAAQAQQHINDQMCMELRQPSSPYKIHQFEMVFPIEPSHNCIRIRRLLKRLRRKGISQVELEPENHRINIRTRKSAGTILAILRGVDSNARLLATYRPTLLEAPYPYRERSL